MPTTIGFIGAGKMGEALIAGMLKQACTADEIVVCTKTAERQAQLHKRYGIRTVRHNVDVVKEARLVFLAVKPQQMDEVLKEVAAALTPHHILISIAAGITHDRVQAITGNHVRVVCLVSNTPARIGEGALALIPDARLTPEELSRVKRLAETAGTVIEIPHDHYNAAMSLAGAGSAFVFWLMRTFIEAGKSAGLTESAAKQLTLQTFKGAAMLAMKDPRGLSDLIKDVSSPGGITLEGLKVLDASDVADVIQRTVSATERRATELNK